MSGDPGVGVNLPAGNIAWGDFDPATDLVHTTWNARTQWCRDALPVTPSKDPSKRPKPSPTAKLVLWALVDHADPHGIGWASQETLADECSMVQRTASTALGLLADAGLILRFARRDRAGYRASDVIVLAVCLNATAAARHAHLHANDDITYMQMTTRLHANDDTPTCNSCIAGEPPNRTTQENHPIEPSSSSVTSAGTETETAQRPYGQAMEQWHGIPDPKVLAKELTGQLHASVARRAHTKLRWTPDTAYQPILRLITDGADPATVAKVIAWIETDQWHADRALHPDYLHKHFQTLALQSQPRTNVRGNPKAAKQDLDMRAAELRAAARHAGVDLADGDQAEALAATAGIDFTGLAGFHGYIGHPATNGHATIETTTRELTQGDTK